MDNRKNKKPWWEPGLALFFRIFTSTIIPIILALYIGKYLDDRYNTSPWIFLGLTLIAFLVSIILIWKNLSKYMENVEKEVKDEKNNI